MSPGASGTRRSLGIVVALLGVSTVSLAMDPATDAPTHDWRRLEGDRWQIAGPAPEDPEVTEAREGTRGSCPLGMVAVSGNMRTAPGDTIEMLQNTTCLEWQSKSFPARCARFDPQAWLDVVRRLPSTPMSFCIDRFEYPNQAGAYPVVAVTWGEARSLCEMQSKRLCTEDEWTFACEGEMAMPYPYGYERDAEVCVIDRANPAFDAEALSRRDTARFGLELDRLWRGEPSGALPHCRSAFGVYDMTGNVDEWTSSTRAGGYRSILKGGYWGRIRARCRPSTRAHGETFVFYQQGFRCCAK